MARAPEQAEERNGELQKLGVPVKVVTIGKKGAKYFKRRADRFEVVGARLSCPSYTPMSRRWQHRGAHWHRHLDTQNKRLQRALALHSW